MVFHLSGAATEKALSLAHIASGNPEVETLNRGQCVCYDQAFAWSFDSPGYYILL